MTKYIIVKYAEDNYPKGVAPPEAPRAHPNTYTARVVGVHTNDYPTAEAAQPDLEKMRAYNPTVGYGIVKLEEG